LLGLVGRRKSIIIISHLDSTKDSLKSTKENYIVWSEYKRKPKHNFSFLSHVSTKRSMKIEEKLFPDAKSKPERKFVSSGCKQLERGPQDF
jgi:hypothetical protein